MVIELLKSDINDHAAVKSVLNNFVAKETDIDGLLNVLLKTSSLLVANMIAFRLKEFKDNRILKDLLNRSNGKNKEDQKPGIPG